MYVCFFILIQINTLIEDVNIEGESKENQSFLSMENQCHICKYVMKTKDELFYHVQSQHEVYVSGFMEDAKIQFMKI